jgi:hypothetical protein
MTAAAPPTPRRGVKRTASSGKRATSKKTGTTPSNATGSERLNAPTDGAAPDGVARRRSQRIRTTRARPVSIVLDDNGRARTEDGHVGKGTRLVGGGVVAIEDQAAGNMRGQHGVGAPLKTADGVSQAMRDLSRLEAQLDRQVRRQRRNVEESKLVVAEELPDGTIGNQMRRVAGKSLDTDGSTGRVLDGKGKTMEVSPEVGEPLEPWNGRLGYVSEERGVCHGAEGVSRSGECVFVDCRGSSDGLMTD